MHTHSCTNQHTDEKVGHTHTAGSCGHTHGSGHKHAHHHHHSHGHGDGARGVKLLWVFLLNITITIVEIAGGILSNSLSLLSDAVHNLGDSLALLFAYVAHKIGRKKANYQHTFGYKRVEILTALLNASILVAICLFLLKEAYERYMNPEPIESKLMLIVAIIGLVANWISVLILQKDKNHNMNIKAAYLHLLGDTLSSVAVILGGLAILFFDLVWIDPLVTVLVSLYIIYHTWGVLKESVSILMQATPIGIDIPALCEKIKQVPLVKDIHHVHIWRLNEDRLHFESHINVRENIKIDQLMVIQKQVESILHAEGINHTTLQFGHECCVDTDNSLIQE